MSRPLPRRGSTFPPYVKQTAVQKVLSGEPRKKVASELGITEYGLHVWICAHLPQPEDFQMAVNLLKRGATRHAVREAFGGKMPLSNLQVMKFTPQ